MPNYVFDAYKEAIFDNLENVLGGWIITEKQGWRRLLAQILRRPTFDALWLGPLNEDGSPDERITIVWDAGGVFTIEGTRNEEMK